MATQLKREIGARKQRALELMAAGEAPSAVARKVGVALSTIYRWGGVKRPRGRRSAGRPTLPRQEAAEVQEMLAAEGPAVARVLLDMAKEGDVRAASLVVRLLGNTLTRGGSDERDTTAALEEFECGLQSLPADIASEIVGLLAKAESGSAGPRPGPGALARDGEQRRRHLPWEADDSPSDEGADSV